VQTLYSVESLAKDVLLISKSKVYRYVETGELPCTRLGNRIRFTDEQVQDFVKKQATKGGKRK
jgi:excisionase family DNA binding protein